MKATQILHGMGQSLWLDNITRDLLDSGTLKHYSAIYVKALEVVQKTKKVPKDEEAL